ncbi:MAG: hypothetical protein ACK5QC_13900 [Bacteroidota bacterium]
MNPLLKKLNFKAHKEIVVLNAPISFKKELESFSELTSVKIEAKNLKEINFVLIFVTTKEQIEASMKLVYPKLSGDAVLWYSYPKATSKNYTCNFNRDTGWETLGKHNFEPVRQVAIDEDWSALRFRKTEYIKTMTRNESIAISKAGKERVKKIKTSN